MWKQWLQPLVGERRLTALRRPSPPQSGPSSDMVVCVSEYVSTGQVHTQVSGFTSETP